MTARDEAINAVRQVPWTQWVGYYERVVDAIPADVLARLAIERGGLEATGYMHAGLTGDPYPLYRVVEP